MEGVGFTAGAAGVSASGAAVDGIYVGIVSNDSLPFSGSKIVSDQALTEPQLLLARTLNASYALGRTFIAK